MTPELSIIIVNWNTKDLLKQCITSIQTSTSGISYETIVIDNASTDGSLEMLRDNFPGIKLIKNTENTGFARANNQGIKVAKGQFLCLLNSDTKIDHDVFTQMVDWLKANPDYGVIGPKLLNPDGSIQHSLGRFPNLLGLAVQLGVPFHVIPGVDLLFPTMYINTRSYYQQHQDVDWVKGACYLLRREVLKNVPGLDPKVFMYMDEVEFSLRIRQAGWGIHYTPDVSVWHLERGSSRTGKTGAILGVYKGLYNYFQKHMPAWQLPILKMILNLGALIRLPFDWSTYSQALQVQPQK